MMPSSLKVEIPQLESSEEEEEEDHNNGTNDDEDSEHLDQFNRQYEMEQREIQNIVEQIKNNYAAQQLNFDPVKIHEQAKSDAEQ